MQSLRQGSDSVVYWETGVREEGLGSGEGGNAKEKAVTAGGSRDLLVRNVFRGVPSQVGSECLKTFQVHGSWEPSLEAGGQVQVVRPFSVFLGRILQLRSEAPGSPHSLPTQGGGERAGGGVARGVHRGPGSIAPSSGLAAGWGRCKLQGDWDRGHPHARLGEGVPWRWWLFGED